MPIVHLSEFQNQGCTWNLTAKIPAWVSAVPALMWAADVLVFLNQGEEKKAASKAGTEGAPQDPT